MEWNACLRCVYKDGTCVKCGRPKGSPKDWKPGVAPINGGEELISGMENVLRSVETLAHSPLGGSAVHRYMACSASVALINLLHEGQEDGDESQEEWTAEGTLAHALGAHCLLNNIPDAFTLMGSEGMWEAVDWKMAESVQVYLDYVRDRLAVMGGRVAVEERFHTPEIHELMFGTIDAKLYSVLHDTHLEIVDYKNGAGVIVNVQKNGQLLFYAGDEVTKNPDLPDEMPVRLTIVQPNAWHPDGRIRYWETTVGAIRQWLVTELVPAMQRTQERDGWFFDMGEHCRFCPAKLACPAFANLTHRALTDTTFTRLTAAECDLLQMYIKEYRKQAFNRLMAGAPPEEVGAKLVYGKANRQWKDGAEQAVREALGPLAFTEPELKSPAQLEDVVGGKALVARWAYTPDGKPTVVSLEDGRASAVPNVASAIRGRHVALASAVHA